MVPGAQPSAGPPAVACWHSPVLRGSLLARPLYCEATLACSTCNSPDVAVAGVSDLVARRRESVLCQTPLLLDSGVE